MEDIIYYENKEFVKQVIDEPWNYLIFEISECTIENLNKKCDFILTCQKLDWKPLKLEYKEGVHVYIKTFWIKK